MRNQIYVAVGIIILVNTVFILSKVSGGSIENASYISNIIMMLIQIFALYVIVSQLKHQKYLSIAQFISQTMDQLAEQKEFHQKLQSVDDPEITNSEIVAFLNVFENIAALIETGVIGIEDIDNPFAYRFFLTVHHPKVQKMELLEDKAYYKAIFKLHKQWVEYRKSKKLKTINIQNSLDKEPLYNELAA
ncbi:hypothetical protein [Teredinibacter turnerae]|uniref:hypothetical protein n=1 Tax=Teredinibacter turnerae TaxID=2426 RepID=UPI00036C9769|nr:hypothetical protein [Teredinibacter turnerae]